jgi:hypothetical protein
MSHLCLLGQGFVGQHFLNTYKDHYDSYEATTRSHFTLQKELTWSHLKLGSYKKEECYVLWTFEAARTLEDLTYALSFYKKYLLDSKVIILGTTSSYEVRTPHELVSEDTPLQKENLRSYAEEELRTLGACILRLSGIFGNERDPVNWYKRGLIKSPSSYLNLIHVKDIAYAIYKLFENFHAHEVFNLSNGYFKTHL